MENNPFDIFTDKYENWFKANYKLFQSELLALKQVVATDKKGLEIGNFSYRQTVRLSKKPQFY